MPRTLLLAALLLPLLGGCRLKYAVLEYNCIGATTFYLNGVAVPVSPTGGTRYAVLSTADGTLPLAFRDGPQTLAVSNEAGPGAGTMMVSWKLTVQVDNYHILMSNAQSARMLDLVGAGGEPAGWEQPGFDDSSWSGAQELDDPAWASIPTGLSPPSSVKKVSHAGGDASAAYHLNLFRQTFSLDRPQIEDLAKQASNDTPLPGELVTYTLSFLDFDQTSSQVRVWDSIPAGLSLLAVPAGASYNPPLLSWNLGSPGAGAIQHGILRFNGVEDGGAWQAPAAALGAADGNWASFSQLSGTAGFSLEPPPHNGAGPYKLRELMLHTVMRHEGAGALPLSVAYTWNGSPPASHEFHPLGSGTAALEIYDGYDAMGYGWNWQNLADMKVWFRSESPSALSQLDAAWVSFAYARPVELSYTVQVDLGAECQTLENKAVAGLYGGDNQLVSAWVDVACATPTPTPTSTPTGTEALTATPSPTPSSSITATPTASPSSTPSSTTSPSQTPPATDTSTPSPSPTPSPAAPAVFSPSSADLRLHGVYPHPIGAQGGTFVVDAPFAGELELVVATVRGEKVITITRALALAGPHEIFWDARNGQGQPVSFGSYHVLLRLSASGRNQQLRQWITVKR